MNFAAFKTNWPRLKDFLGAQVITYGSISIFFGLLQFGIDVALAFSINAFFIALGLNPTTFPMALSWLPTNLTSVILLLLTIATLRGLLVWMQTFVNGIALTEFEYLNRKRVSAWALSQRQSRISQVATLYNDIIVGASNFISGFLIVASRAVAVVLLFGSLLKLSVFTTLVISVVLFVLILPLKIMSQKITVISKKIFKDFDNSLDRLLMGVKNSLLLHIYNTFKHEERHIHSSLTSYRAQYRRFYLISGLKGVLPFVFGVWLICFITLLSTRFSGIALPTSLLISYFYLFVRFVQSLGEIANTVSRLNLTRPRFVELSRWWQTAKADTPPVIPQNNSIVFSSAIGWQINNMSFAYDKEQPIFDHFNLTIPPKSVIGISGPSGRGKSTLLSLLLGLHTPNQGSIQVIDQNGQYSLSDVRAALLDQIGYVGPESFLIAGSIRDNLQYGAGGQIYSDPDMLTALGTAECDFAGTLGLDHILTEQGEGLSAGQKQRLTLARALLRRPKALILDEATANLDKITEARIIETLKKLKESLTIVIVTHKDALLTLADQHLNLE